MASRGGGTGRGPGRTARTAGQRGTARAGAARPRAGSGKPETRVTLTRLPERRSLRRMVVLGGTLVVLAILIVPTLRSYLRQQTQIQGLRDRVSEQRGDVTALQREQARWSDPAFVEQQARKRLGFVRPGERSYIVIHPGQSAADASRVAEAPAASADDPWYGRLWQSARIADQGVPATP